MFQLFLLDILSTSSFSDSPSQYPFQRAFAFVSPEDHTIPHQEHAGPRQDNNKRFFELPNPLSRLADQPPCLNTLFDDSPLTLGSALLSVPDPSGSGYLFCSLELPTDDDPTALYFCVSTQYLRNAEMVYATWHSLLYPQQTLPLPTTKPYMVATFRASHLSLNITSHFLLRGNISSSLHLESYSCYSLWSNQSIYTLIYTLSEYACHQSLLGLSVLAAVCADTHRQSSTDTLTHSDNSTDLSGLQYPTPFPPTAQIQWLTPAGKNWSIRWPQRSCQ